MSGEGDPDTIASPDGSDGSSISSPTSNPPWWREKKSARPWVDKPRRKRTVPPEQAEGFSRARRSVAKAVRSVLGTGVGVLHEALIIGVEPLALAPVPGLSEAARSLLAIWDALEQVDTNRMACVSLVERCADILFAVREEVELGGGQVTDILQDPVNKLTAAFKLTQDTMTRQWDKPFLKRYLQREADLRRIGGCNQALTDAVSLFSLSIQIRTLRQLQESESARRHDMSLFRPGVVPLANIYPPSPPISVSQLPPYPALDKEYGSSSTLVVTSLSEQQPKASQVLPSIERLQQKHAAIDGHLDAEDLRTILRAALHEPDDASMIRMLQIDRPEWPEAIKTLQRTLEDLRAKGDKGEEVIHREFVESGIECLRRMSGEGDTSVPSWTITKFEVDTEAIIGLGSFSSVYRGTWKHRTVAIKIVSDSTPRSLFVHEIQIWSRLSHPHVLRILGASSATNDPPWFFVSPYMKNGSLVTYLKKNVGLRNINELSMIHQVAVGMQYLHSQGVLHGDLKGANVLIDDELRCVISDFGQSRLKSEIYRLSGHKEGGDKPGTTRWQAPEMLKGDGGLTAEVDVYAFAITCIEILTGGELPWAELDDVAVRHLVVNENRRPSIPLTQQTSIALITLLKSCWDIAPSLRPSFESISTSVEQLLSGSGPHEQDLTPSGKPQPPFFTQQQHEPSPDLRPISLSTSVESAIDLDANGKGSGVAQGPPRREGSPLRGLGMTGIPSSETSGTTSSYNTAHSQTHSSSHSAPASSPQEEHDHEHPELLDPGMTPKPVSSELHNDDFGFHPPPSTRPSTIYSSTESTHETDIEWDGYESPPPLDDIIALRRDERRYRLLLTHSFYSSLKLPLWTPSRVRVGALGYHTRPKGEFITLFNAFETAADVGSREDVMPSLHGYGIISQESVRHDSRSAKERALEGLRSLIPFSRRQDGSASRRVSFPLRAGHKQAYLYTESTAYRYMSNLTTPKKWLKSNIDNILRVYGPEHHLQREDILLIIGTLEAPDYAMFVSHKSRDGQVHFEVFNDRRTGQNWGEFKTDETMPHGAGGGPAWDEREEHPIDEVYSSKVSKTGDSANGWHSLILARLRFRPDEDDPTSQ